MYSTTNDSVKTSIQDNPFEGDSSQVSMYNNTFLPSFYITPMNDGVDLQSYDIWRDNKEISEISIDY